MFSSECEKIAAMRTHSRPRVVRVPARSSDYPVLIGKGLLDRIDELLPDSLRGRTTVLITSENVGILYADRAMNALSRIGPVHRLTVPDGERHKSLTTVGRLYAGMTDLGIDRSALVAALGGGVVGDLVGFVAATYMRGLRFVQIPTTLLAQVDASVGGKVGVNLPQGKNLVGTFHQPAAVFADTETLRTLPPREMNAGLMEVIKYALLGDLALWRYLTSHVGKELDLDHIVEASVRDKARVVAADEREAGHRRVLNLGHTLAHALESATRYRVYLHGEAVGLGLVYAYLVAHRMGRVARETVDAVVDLVRRAGLRLALPRVTFERLRRAFEIDKKVDRGTLHFVLPVGLGRVQIVTAVPESSFSRAYQDLRVLARSA